VGLAPQPVPWTAVQTAVADAATVTRAALAAAWPPPLPGWHLVDGGPDDVRLTLAIGDARHVARALDCQADAIDLAGFDAGGDAWPPALLDVLARRAVAGALAFGGPAHDGEPESPHQPALQAALRSAGFVALDADGPGTIPGLYRLMPRATIRRPTGRVVAPGQALVIGAGLAGGWAAHTLRQQGWHVTVFDRQGGPACEASGNPGGLFHGTVLADDGPHARLQRAAALHATQALAPWLRSGRVAGALDGLLRLAGAGETLASMQALIERHALPAAYVQALDANQASVRASVALQRPAWFYPGGGWLDPGALVRGLLDGATVRCGVDIAALRRVTGGWQRVDRAGRAVAEAATVVLAHAAGAGALWPTAGWPLGRSRGQISLWPCPPADAPRPRVPLAGGGYLLALGDGALLGGATAAPGDEDASVRDADHRFNLARLQALTGWSAPWPAQGRVAWRAMTQDRLPLVGPVPAGAMSASTRLDRVDRAPGLYVLSGLGSRGITWGPLMARVLAAWISGAPMPVEAPLRDALDPARWQVRAARRV
jgi:tRNA 5-methylaminomethyl-2-thiouridine biosynthesis bifunctional protein